MSSANSEEEYSEEEEDLQGFLNSRGQTERGQNNNSNQGPQIQQGQNSVNNGGAPTQSCNNEQPYPREWRTWERQSQSDEGSREETGQSNSGIQASNHQTNNPSPNANIPVSQDQRFNHAPNYNNQHYSNNAAPQQPRNQHSEQQAREICPINGCESSIQRTGSQRDNHILSHFKDELIKDLKDRSSPYKCPLPNCSAFSAKNIGDWARHYGLGHNKLHPIFIRCMENQARAAQHFSQNNVNHSQPPNGPHNNVNQYLPSPSSTQNSINSHVDQGQVNSQMNYQQQYPNERQSPNQQHPTNNQQEQMPMPPQQQYHQGNPQNEAQNLQNQEIEEELVEQEEEEDDDGPTIYRLNMGEEPGDKDLFVELKDYDAIKEERDNLTKEIEAIKQKFNKTIQEQMEKQKIQLEAYFHNRIEKIEQEKGRALTEVRSAQMMVKELQKQIVNTPPSNDSSENLVKMENENIGLKQHISQLEKEKSELKATSLEKMQIALEEVKNRENAVKKLKDECEKLQNDLHQRDRSQEDLVNQHGQLNHQFNVVKEKLRVLETERQIPFDGPNEIKEKYAELFSANQARMGEITQLKLTIDRLQNEINIKTNQINDMDYQFNQLKENNATIQQIGANQSAIKMNELEQALKRKDAQVQEKSFLIEKAQRENAVERANSESMSRKIIELEQRNQKLQEINAAVKQAETDIMVESKQKLEIALEEVKKANAAEKALNKEKKEYQNEIDKSKKAITSLNSQLAIMKQRLENRGHSQEPDPKTKQELDESKKIIDDLKSRLNEAKNENMEKSRQIDSLRTAAVTQISNLNTTEGDSSAIKSFKKALEIEKETNSSLRSQLNDLQAQATNLTEQIGTMEVAHEKSLLESRKGPSQGSNNLHAIAQKRLAEISQLKMINDRITRDNNKLAAEAKEHRASANTCKVAGHIEKAEGYARIKMAFLENNKVSNEDKATLKDNDIIDMATELVKKHLGMKRHYEAEIMNSVDKIRKLGRKVFEQASMEKLSSQLAVNESAVATLNKKLLVTVKELKASQTKAIKLEESVKKFSKIAQVIKEMDAASNKQIAEEKAKLASRASLEENKLSLLKTDSLFSRTTEDESPSKFSRSPLLKKLSASSKFREDLVNRKGWKEDSPARKALEERLGIKRKNRSEDPSDNEEEQSGVVIENLSLKQKTKTLPSQTLKTVTLPKQTLKKLEKYDPFENYD